MSELVDAGEEVPLDVVPLAALAAEQRTQYFVDDRDGEDRWGNPHRGRWVCGTSWEDACPLYLEESCPGEKNKGVRWEPAFFAQCDMRCGACGGYTRAETINYCGSPPKGQPMLDLAIAEMGGSLRLDRRPMPSATPAAAPPWPVSFAGTVEWGSGHLLELAKPPMVFVTMKTAKGSRHSRTSLRDRLGGYEGIVGVNGLCKDDVLDLVWDTREETIEFCMEANVHTFVTPQYSYYDGDPIAMWLFNESRGMEFYRLAVDAGFPVVALDCPPWSPDYLHRDRLEFIREAKVKCIAMSYQTRRNMHPTQVRYARELHGELDDDVSMIFFGVNTLAVMLTLSKLYPGRNVLFSNVEAFAKQAFFRLMNNQLAPPAWSERAEGHKVRCKCPECKRGKKLGKARTFQYNLAQQVKFGDLVRGQASAAADRSASPVPSAGPLSRSVGAAVRRRPRRARRGPR
jgi:hypothetical protein